MLSTLHTNSAAATIARLLDLGVDPFQLTASPMDIEMAGDGVEALARVEKQLPNLVITDVMMPNMDGFALCERLRADIRTAFVPVIILTGSADENSQTKGFLIGTDDIAKPFTIPELNARVMRLLRRTYGVGTGGG